jgi:DNA-binding CsgD family transcriptional regulator
VKLLSYVALVGFLESLVLVAAAWRLGPRVRYNQAMAATGILSAWSGACLVFVLGADPKTALLFQQLNIVGVLGINIPLTILFFELAGLTRHHQNVIAGAAVLCVAIVGAGYLATGSPWTEVLPGPWGNRVVLRPNAWSVGADVFFVAVDLYAVACLTTTMIRSESARLRHLIRFALGAIVGTIPVYLFLQWVEATYQTPSLTFLPGMIVFLVLFYDAVRLKSLHAPSMELTDALADARPQAMLLLDADGRIVGANPAARTLLGDVPLGQLPEAVLAPDVAASLRVTEHFDQFGDPVGAVAVLTSGASLSEREREVLALVVEGLSNADIAARLFISEGTVKTHVHHILDKTGVRRREDLIAGPEGPA